MANAHLCNTQKNTIKPNYDTNYPNGNYHTVTTKPTKKRHTPIYVLQKKNVYETQLQNNKYKTHYKTKYQTATAKQ